MSPVASFEGFAEVIAHPACPPGVVVLLPGPWATRDLSRALIWMPDGTQVLWRDLRDSAPGQYAGYQGA